MREAAGPDRAEAGQPNGRGKATKRKATKRKAAKRSTKRSTVESRAAAAEGTGSAAEGTGSADVGMVGRGIAAPIGRTAAPAPTKRATPEPAGPDAAAAMAAVADAGPRNGAAPGADLDGLDPLALVDVGLSVSVQIAARMARVDPELPELLAACKLTAQERIILRSCNLEGWCKVGQSWLNTPNGTSAAIGGVLLLHLFQVYSVLKRERRPPPDDGGTDTDRDEAPRGDLPPDASRLRSSRAAPHAN